MEVSQEKIHVDTWAKKGSALFGPSLHSFWCILDAKTLESSTYSLQIEAGGAYHLHGKPGNSSWKIKWYASFHLEYSEIMGFWLK